MKRSHAERDCASLRVSARNLKRLKNAIARRKLQEMQDEKMLRAWLAEVWEQTARADVFDRNGRMH